MSGSRRRRRRERPPQPCPDQGPDEPMPQGFAPLREVAVAERPSKKTCHAPSSPSTTTSSPDVWADLLDSLLHQIISLLSSFHDLLALIGTCRSWRAALSTLPPTFSFNFPPLHLRPYCHPRRSYFKHISLSGCKWQLTDPTKRTPSLHCSALQNLQVCTRYLGCSNGYLIFSFWDRCILIDAYSGAYMRPPKLKSTSSQEIYCGTLVAAPNSSNSQLLLFSKSFMFQWQVGTNSWLGHPFEGGMILQIVSFKGAMFAMDFQGRLHRICLAPQFSIQEVAVVWEKDMVVGLNLKPWLVVCGDMLLLVDLSVNMDGVYGFSLNFKVFRLDLSVEPAKWVKVDNLGNCAIFVSFDRRNPTFSSISPERWGGKSNCIYVAGRSEDSDEAWTVIELGQMVPGTMLCSTYSSRSTQTPSGHGNELQNLWVLPSFVYGVGR